MKGSKNGASRLKPAFMVFPLLTGHLVKTISTNNVHNSARVPVSGKFRLELVDTMIFSMGLLSNVIREQPRL